MDKPKPISRDLIEETMASWGLEGMEPSAETLADIRALADGEISLEEFKARTREGMPRGE